MANQRRFSHPPSSFTRQLPAASRSSVSSGSSTNLRRPPRQHSVFLSGDASPRGLRELRSRLFSACFYLGVRHFGRIASAFKSASSINVFFSSLLLLLLLLRWHQVRSWLRLTSVGFRPRQRDGAGFKGPVFCPFSQLYFSSEQPHH